MSDLSAKMEAECTIPRSPHAVSNQPHTANLTEPAPVHRLSPGKSQVHPSSDAQAMCGTLVLTTKAAPHRANDRGLDQETVGP